MSSRPARRYQLVDNLVNNGVVSLGAEGADFLTCRNEREDSAGERDPMLQFHCSRTHFSGSDGDVVALNWCNLLAPMGGVTGFKTFLATGYSPLENLYCYFHVGNAPMAGSSSLNTNQR